MVQIFGKFSRKLILNLYNYIIIYQYHYQLFIRMEKLNEEELMYVIHAGVPEAVEIIETISDDYYNEDILVTFLMGLIDNKVFGYRIYYIWKYVCDENDEELVNMDFTPYNDAYFADKPV